MQDQAIRKDEIIKVVPGDRFTPYALAVKLNAKVILESSSYKKGRERYSLLMVKEAFRLTERSGSVWFEKDGASTPWQSRGKDILDDLSYFASQQHGPAQDFPFPAGGIGYLGYEYATKFDTLKLDLSKPDGMDIPDAMFLFGHVFAIFDHYTDLIYLIGLNYTEASVDLDAEIAATEKRMFDLDFNFMANESKPSSCTVLNDLETEKKAYCDGVQSIRTEIIAGNLLQGVLSRRLKVETRMTALEAYRGLRSVNPSPYLFYLDFGAFQLFGASPEVHVKAKNGAAEIRPIAGTRRRGKSEAEDRFLEKELLADPKERAEHLMLVDLARNDLGRVSAPGTVRVTEYAAVERYSHVMHIVSKVEGTLAAGKTGLDALRASFPAGTVSGAPKIKAMEIIDGLESERRSFYAGVVGYVDASGDLDTCIAIRCAVKKDGILYLQAGAGIVYDSVPEREWEETNEKLRALARSVGLEV